MSKSEIKIRGCKLHVPTIRSGALTSTVKCETNEDDNIDEIETDNIRHKRH